MNPPPFEQAAGGKGGNMANKVLDGMRVAILVTDHFEQAEMTEPRKALKAAGAETVYSSHRTAERYRG